MGFTRLNGVYGTVGTQSNSGSTSVVLGTGQGGAFASASTDNPIRCAVIDTSTQPETLKFFLDVTGRSTDTLTVANRGVTDGNVSSADANILVGYTIAAVTSVSTLTAVPRNTQTGTTYTLVLGDAGSVVRCTNASAVTVTVPPASSVAFPLDTILNVRAMGAGGVTIAAGAGVTIRNNTGGLSQYSEASLQYDGSDVWVRVG